ncbi:MAG: hypothetical protein LBJ00_02230 [Planctomycetaceae bacterium]|jgi:hypothetical protein|nr:hypothetical protein [Planctomycetaceae bacterium]
MSPIVPEDNNKPRKSHFILILFILIVLNVLTFCFFFFEPYIRQSYIVANLKTSSFTINGTVLQYFHSPLALDMTKGIFVTKIPTEQYMDQSTLYFLLREQVITIDIDAKGVTVTPQDIDKISQISKLPFLNHITIHNMTMTDLLADVLLNCKGLEHLGLHDVAVTDHQLLQITGDKSLISINLKISTKISEQAFIEFLEANPQLRNIGIADTPLMTDQIASAISELQLESVYFSNVALTDKHIEIMSKNNSIKIFIVFSCPDLSDESFQYFEQMTLLTMLALRDTNVTAAGVAEFKSAKPACKVHANPK